MGEVRGWLEAKSIDAEEIDQRMLENKETTSQKKTHLSEVLIGDGCFAHFEFEEVFSAKTMSGEAEGTWMPMVFGTLLQDFEESGILERVQPGQNGKIPAGDHDPAKFHKP
jgi:hypothetical protein